MCTPWIIAIGFLVAANCSLVGTFLMLRKKAMIGDAISHGVLLGIVVAFLLSGTTHITMLIIGALVAAITMMWLINFLVSLKVNHEAAIGIVFTSFFALGIVFIALYTQKVDLDQGCVLYGQILTALFDKIKLGEWAFPHACVTLGGLLLINLTFIVMSYPKLQIVTFDPSFGASMGIKATKWDYALVLLTSLTAVLSFKIVGAPLVITFLIAPPATAYLLTNRLSHLLGYALIIDALVSLYGYTLAVAIKASVPGGMATVAGLIFGIAFFYYTLQQKKQNASTILSA